MGCALQRWPVKSAPTLMKCCTKWSLHLLHPGPKHEPGMWKSNLASSSFSSCSTSQETNLFKSSSTVGWAGVVTFFAWTLSTRDRTDAVMSSAGLASNDVGLRAVKDVCVDISHCWIRVCNTVAGDAKDTGDSWFEVIWYNLEGVTWSERS